ncbi:MAG: hypothetical protein RIR62_831 [Pseudomonadota bacterium]
MSIVTVRARDSQRAMDEVIRRLGADAYILSTTQAGGMVEIRAARDPQPDTAPPRFASALAEAAAERPRVPAATRPVPLPDTATLARRLLLPDRAGDWQPPRIVLAGPPGAGKSMLAARLAARVLRDGSGRRPRLIAPHHGARLTEDRLRGWARLMGLAPEYLPLDAAIALPEPHPLLPEIIDLSDVPAHAVELAGHLAALPETEVLLCLPAGLHPARIAALAAPWQGFGASVCLTNLDAWEPEQDELAALAAAGLRLRLLADGAGLLDTLRLAELSDLDHWASGWDAAPAADAAPRFDAPRLDASRPAAPPPFSQMADPVPVFRHGNRKAEDAVHAAPPATGTPAAGDVLVFRAAMPRSGGTA